jgi:hypothetical protein
VEENGGDFEATKEIPIHFLVLQSNSSFYQNVCISPDEKLERYAGEV